MTTHESFWTILTAEASDLLLSAVSCVFKHLRRPQKKPRKGNYSSGNEKRFNRPQCHRSEEQLRLSFHLAHFDMSLLLLVTEQIRKAEDGKLDAYSSLTAEMTLRIYELKGEASLGDSHSMLLLWSLSL